MKSYQLQVTELLDSAAYKSGLQHRADTRILNLEMFAPETVSISRRHSSFTFLFSSNEAKTGKGFMVKIVQEPYTCSDDLPDSSLFPTDSLPEDFGPPAARPQDFDPPVARPQEFNPVTRPQAQTGSRGCDQRLLGPSGLIRSPGYPRIYGPNMRCRYTLLRLNSGVCRVQISFKRFNLENSYGCRKDYLELPDRSRLCGRYTGTRTYDFKQDFLNLYFISDRFRADSGFEIEVRQLQNSCLNPSAQMLPFPREADELRMVFTSDITTNRKGFEIKVTQEAGGCFRAPLSKWPFPPMD
ncbi:uncharacterized protein LOC8031972 [Ixodes scapularis]|uniref:uncharacterized protein LOC8031972 n=1 Tax=Ixodes scapularis TaxID=6945 RepID=UPI001C394A03|nr:uncharacterized protein LOC8031972 [Ixodes scapularis]